MLFICVHQLHFNDSHCVLWIVLSWIIVPGSDLNISTACAGHNNIIVMDFKCYSLKMWIGGLFNAIFPPWTCLKNFCFKFCNFMELSYASAVTLYRVDFL